MYQADGIMVLCDGKFVQVCSTEDMAERVAFLRNLAVKVQVADDIKRAYLALRKARIREMNERTRKAYLENFMAV